MNEQALAFTITIPVAVLGGIATIDDAEQILASGKADMVAMAKRSWPIRNW